MLRPDVTAVASFGFRSIHVREEKRMSSVTTQQEALAAAGTLG